MSNSQIELGKKKNPSQCATWRATGFKKASYSPSSESLETPDSPNLDSEFTNVFNANMTTIQCLGKCIQMKHSTCCYVISHAAVDCLMLYMRPCFRRL